MFEVKDRYYHQILFKGIGEAGQRRISSGSVCIVGCGALGSMAAMGLVRAGVGKIRIIDRDFVEMPNLHRQILFDEEDVQKIMPKAVAAEARLRKINSTIHIEGVVSELSHFNVEKLCDGFALIIDGTDNFETRFLINEFSIKNSIPWIYGAALGSYGLTFNIIPGDGPCLQCVFEALPPSGTLATCDTAGIINSVPTIIASIQCAEALKILSGRREKLNSFISIIDVWEGVLSRVALRKEKSDCSVCDRREFKLLQGEGVPFAVRLCGRNAVQIYPRSADPPVDLASLKNKLEGVADARYNGFLLRIKAEEFEITVFADGRTVVCGTMDTSLARSMYAKYVKA